MKIMRAAVGLLACLLAVSGCVERSAPATGLPFWALSLREASRLVQASAPYPDEMTRLCGITRIAGFILDSAARDIVLFGQVDPAQPEILMDDLVVALRAQIVFREWPLVSIDPTPDTKRSGLQAVRFRGGLADTRVGRDMLDCDLWLKRYCLHMISPQTGIPSYRDRTFESLQRNLAASGVTVVEARWMSGAEVQRRSEDWKGMPVVPGTTYAGRFWFALQDDPNVNAAWGEDGLIVLEGLHLGVREERNPVPVGGAVGGDTSSVAQDRRAFAQSLTDRIDDLAEAYPLLKRFKRISDVTTIAHAIARYSTRPDIDPLIHAYALTRYPTEREIPLERVVGSFRRSDGGTSVLSLAGGVEIRPEVRQANRGILRPLKQLVLGARPRSDSLAWRVPADGWVMPNSPLLNRRSEPSNRSTVSEPTGCAIQLDTLEIPAPRASGATRVVFNGFRGPTGLLEPPSEVKGVSLRMSVSDASFREDRTGELARRREDILGGRPQGDALSWRKKEIR